MRKIFASFILFFLCSQVSASVVINEIAWQGFGGDANNEWVELLNTGSSTILLDGWLLESSDGTPSINLTGVSVSAGGFVLLERTDDETVPNVSADLIYTGALANTGENLILKNGEGAVVDTANFSSGWTYPSDTSNTLSRFGTSWGEGVATPGSGNIEIDGGQTQTSDDDTDTNEEDEESSQVSTSSSQENTKLYKTRKLTIESSGSGFINVPIVFDSYVRDYDGDELRKGIFSWNMGDGTVFFQGRNEPFQHVYQYPGEYIVSLAFNRNHFGQDVDDLEPDLIEEKVIVISETPVSLENVLSDGTFSLKNNSSKNVDVGGWKVTNGDTDFFIPRRTIIRANNSVTFSSVKTRLQHNPLSLFTPTGTFVEIKSHTSQKATTSSSAVQKFSVETTVKEIVQEPVVVEDIEEENSVLSASASTPIHQASGTLYTVLFIVIALGGSGVIWFVSSREKTTIIDGYEIVEE